MKSNLTSIPLTSFEKKKKRWWQFWKTYNTHYKAKYDVRFRIKPAGINFELWYNGQDFSDGSHFDVQWEDAGIQMRSPKPHRKTSEYWTKME